MEYIIFRTTGLLVLIIALTFTSAERGFGMAACCGVSHLTVSSILFLYYAAQLQLPPSAHPCPCSCSAPHPCLVGSLLHVFSVFSRPWCLLKRQWFLGKASTQIHHSRTILMMVQSRAEKEKAQAFEMPRGAWGWLASMLEPAEWPAWKNSPPIPEVGVFI